MRTLIVSIAFLMLAASAALAQTTNWGGAVEVEAVPDAWTYTMTPGWYFWSGAGVSFTFGMIGMVMRFLRRLDMNDPMGGGE